MIECDDGRVTFVGDIPETTRRAILRRLNGAGSAVDGPVVERSNRACPDCGPEYVRQTYGGSICTSCWRSVPDPETVGYDVVSPRPRRVTR